MQTHLERDVAKQTGAVLQPRLHKRRKLLRGVDTNIRGWPNVENTGAVYENIQKSGGHKRAWTGYRRCLSWIHPFDAPDFLHLTAVKMVLRKI